jgi:hypothetical protein
MKSYPLIQKKSRALNKKSHPRTGNGFDVFSQTTTYFFNISSNSTSKINVELAGNVSLRF